MGNVSGSKSVGKMFQTTGKKNEWRFCIFLFFVNNVTEEMAHTRERLDSDGYCLYFSWFSSRAFPGHHFRKTIQD